MSRLLQEAKVAARTLLRLGVAPWLAALETLAFWFVVESLLCLIKGWPLSIWSGATTSRSRESAPYSRSSSSCSQRLLLVSRSRRSTHNPASTFEPCSVMRVRMR